MARGKKEKKLKMVGFDSLNEHPSALYPTNKEVKDSCLFLGL